jgi:hypothetical protein
MLTRLAAVLTSVSVTACSVVGVRSAEEPAFSVVDRVGGVEIRQYGPRVAAQTVVAADVESARGTGFRRIAGYIFGGNHARASIAMTAPVAQGSEQIAMTAPVAQAPAEQQDSGAQIIQFFMPKQYSLGSLPVPNDPAVQLVAVPAQTMAVLRFSGSIAPDAVATQQTALLDALKTSPWHPTGAVVAWFYDPPWTLPPFRRNEVAVPVARP